MKTPRPNPTSTRSFPQRLPILAAAAALLFPPLLNAQVPSPAGNPPAPAKEKLYNLKFDGGATTELRDSLRQQFPADNVVLSGSVERLEIPAFELRNVRLAEIGRTIEFLGDAQLRVEVSENAGIGNVWLIGRMNPSEAAATVRIRSVAAPNLFADEKALDDIEKAASDMDLERAQLTGMIGGARGLFRGTGLQQLKSQQIFVITGDEEGVAGVESLIKAAEQRLEESAAAKAAAVAANGPRMRAVLAPHVFAQEQRWKKLMETTEIMRRNWEDLNSELLKASGLESSSASNIGLPWVQVEPRQEQKVFTLFGTEAAIAGIESLIQAAEKLAAEEDGKTSAELKAGGKPAKEGTSEP